MMMTLMDGSGQLMMMVVVVMTEVVDSIGQLSNEK